ncbi:hypothetical protein WQ53_15965 [Pseudoxanthomonas suwonensis]|uniref:Lipoprotein n=2 Tax=Pseudoxanthomonas suwonensis TaxID=314722 RepID=A0A0E3UPH5_9GAMM|nr:hypothetical protein WQ53_15965 [Pseudoxanthomonas suwonensis]
MKGKLIALSMVAVVAACAHSGPSLTSAERLELYQAHAGPPVASFRIDRIAGVTRWTPLGDQALAFWNTPNQGYLLEFHARCSGLSIASSITISNSMGLVNARLDSVQPRAANGSAISQPCRISSARPIDGRALNDAKRELREASVVERPADVEPDGGD